MIKYNNIEKITRILFCFEGALTHSPVDDYVTPMVCGVVAVMLVLAAIVAVVVICRKR